MIVLRKRLCYLSETLENEVLNFELKFCTQADFGVKVLDRLTAASLKQEHRDPSVDMSEVKACFAIAVSQNRNNHKI